MGKGSWKGGIKQQDLGWVPGPLGHLLVTFLSPSCLLPSPSSCLSLPRSLTGYSILVAPFLQLTQLFPLPSLPFLSPSLIPICLSVRSRVSQPTTHKVFPDNKKVLCLCLSMGFPRILSSDNVLLLFFFLSNTMRQFIWQVLGPHMYQILFWGYIGEQETLKPLASWSWCSTGNLASD